MNGAALSIEKKKKYTPVLSDLERRAYHAAHRILSERAYSARMATPGGQRTAIVDGLAKIIMEVFKADK